MIIYCDEPEKLKMIIGELFLNRNKFSLSDATENFLSTVQVEPINKKTTVLKRITGYIENVTLKKIKHGFIPGFFSNTRSPDQSILNFHVWKLEDKVYVNKEDHTKITIVLEEP